MDKLHLGRADTGLPLEWEGFPATTKKWSVGGIGVSTGAHPPIPKSPFLHNESDKTRVINIPRYIYVGLSLSFLDFFDSFAWQNPISSILVRALFYSRIYVMRRGLTSPRTDRLESILMSDVEVDIEFGRHSTQGELILGRKGLDPGRARPRPREVGARHSESSTQLGKEGARPRDKVLDPRRVWLDLGRKVFDLGRAQPRPGEEGDRPRESSIWGGMCSTQEELNLGNKALDPRRAQPQLWELLDLGRARHRPGEEMFNSGRVWLDPGSKAPDPELSLDPRRKLIDQGRARLGRNELNPGRARPEEERARPREESA
ncbi:hypothetical protein FNV43_RR14819 [Rhamnella rubrinervis]|uniref:Uncharacterized protein n=1 Tax=Rhamnella rubrinervis TaxID=2594499 RepID=A0A8K0H3I4_9ROSA|nr:hypothetical protein FNV43_RR14819 [Rhamnella rubrinervis]